jgi:hypothetical protein
MRTQTKKPLTKGSIIRKLDPKFYFYLSDGRPLKSLLELADAIEEMDDDVFHHHVSQDMDDFAKWVSDVFQDEELAIKLGRSKSRHTHQIAILKHLVRRLSE